jgi:hypothetical protein
MALTIRPATQPKGHLIALGTHRQATPCDCAAHRAASHAAHHAQPGDAAPPQAAGSWWTSVAPVLACAVCPACMSTYAKVLSTLGVGVFLTETQHHALLIGAVSLSLAIGVWRGHKGRRWSPFFLTLLGCALLVSGHLLGDVRALSWSGMAVLLGGGLWEHRLWRRVQAAPQAVPVGNSAT